MDNKMINVYAIRNIQFKPVSKDSDSFYNLVFLPRDFVNLAWSYETTMKVVDILKGFNHYIKSDKIFPLYDKFTEFNLSIDEVKKLKRNIPLNHICIGYMKVTSLESYKSENEDVQRALEELCAFWDKGYIVVGDLLNEVEEKLVIHDYTDIRKYNHAN